MCKTETQSDQEVKADRIPFSFRIFNRIHLRDVILMSAAAIWRKVKVRVNFHLNQQVLVLCYRVNLKTIINLYTFYQRLTMNLNFW